jgi:hypothetical protein
MNASATLGLARVQALSEDTRVAVDSFQRFALSRSIFEIRLTSVSQSTRHCRGTNRSVEYR